MGSLEERISALERGASTAADEHLVDLLDVVWLLLSAMVVFLMQVGFCMLEAGCVRSKSTDHTMIKNLGDLAISSIVWWAIGYALTFGEGNGFIGHTSEHAFFSNGAHTGYQWAFIFFQFNFLATATTVVGGAIAERAHISSYLVFSALCPLIVYPPVAHWEWSASGWASPTNEKAFLGGIIDFAGCGAVHMVGGIASLCGAAVIGPRPGRFDTAPVVAGSKAPRWLHRPLPMPGHSTVLQVMGTFILWVGWYGFNAGSTLGMQVGTRADTNPQPSASASASPSPPPLPLPSPFRPFAPSPLRPLALALALISRPRPHLSPSPSPLTLTPNLSPLPLTLTLTLTDHRSPSLETSPSPSPSTLRSALKRRRLLV